MVCDYPDAVECAHGPRWHILAPESVPVPTYVLFIDSMAQSILFPWVSTKEFFINNLIKNIPKTLMNPQ